ncbi:hypothetical protein BBJ28_00021148 [Nothophytophthora sp. Chile5]|nr:hypothetical protein BBJ28_00021148 [Nothophytophthora sp. Chile5]
MANEESDDVAFLTELAGLLSEFGGPLPPSEHLASETTMGYDHLTVDAVLADTETLLLSESAPEGQGSASLSQGSPSSDSSHASAPIPVTQDDETAAQGDSATVDSALEERRRVKHNALAAKRRVRYRQRLKKEWASLRQQDGELSTKLDKLQRIREHAKTCRMNHSLLAVWKAIAMRQMTRRHRAEAEQRRLKAAVTTQAKLIREMSSVLQRQREETPGDSNHLTLSGKQRFSGECNGAALFESLLGELDAVYAQTDEVIRTWGADVKPGATLGYQPTRKWQNGTEYFESVDAMLVPFDFQRTCHAAWQSIISPEEPGTYHYPGVEDTETSIAVRCRVQYQWETFGVAKMMSHFVMRKYMEADRFVFVWRALFEGEDEFAGMDLDDTGWGVVSPFSKDVSASVSECNADGPTVLQHFVRSTPVYFGNASNSVATTARFAEMVVRAGVEEIEEIMNTMEKLLLDEAASPGSCSGAKPGEHGNVPGMSPNGVKR